MKKNNVFEKLFVLDLANNHFGDLNHAKKIVKNFAGIIKKHKINSTIKFQFRDLPNFIHKNFQKSNIHYVRRFLDTRLSEDKFNKLFKFIKKNKIKTSCTPFDETSVTKIENMKFDFIKIASASSLDFNLHERVIKNKIPKIISTGGISIEGIDKIVSFYSKKKQKFAIMHCVSAYPSGNEMLNLNFIKNLKKRYGNINIGWSTHEDPNEFLPGALALSNGANIFEKHIGINSKTYRLNKYSITPEKFNEWLENFKKAEKMLGSYNKRTYSEEISTINKLSRGVYAKKDIKKNSTISEKNIYFAFPAQKNQLTSQDLKKGTTIKKSKVKDAPIKKKDVIFDKKLMAEYKINSYLHRAKAMLNYCDIKIGERFDMELSHHKGILNFERIGCFIFNIVNRDYAKKILIMLPNQKHPSHFHKQKYETFSVIFGTLNLKDGKHTYKLKKGDTVDLKKNSYHEFRSGKEGCVFEEISTTSIKSDSFYKSTKINRISRESRKTFVNSWFDFPAIKF